MSQRLIVPVILVSLLFNVELASGQCTGETASASSCGPRVIPGTPGVHEVVMDVSTVVGAFAPVCGFNVGHGVWFEITPSVTGRLTFSTCHPSTAYDTVLQVWQASGDCEFPIRLDDLCVDDALDAACISACDPSPRSSSVTFHAVAGTTYLFEVGSYNQNSASCTLCLGVRALICGGDSTPPVATISSPISFDCACSAVSIVGSANDPESGLSQYSLEYKPINGSVWATVSTGTAPILNGVLGSWNTTGLAEGYYYLRLTATNGCGASNTDVQIVWIDKDFDTVRLDSPSNGSVVGGIVCFDGTVWDNLCFDHFTADYRPSGGGLFSPVDPSIPQYAGSALNQGFTLWDTPALGLPDGNYDVRVIGTTVCGNTLEIAHTVTVDNSPPTALILSPVDCEYVAGFVDVIGVAMDANLQSWVLQYTGGNANGWVTIGSGTSSVPNGILATWDTTLLPDCAYTLRLVVIDGATLNCNNVVHGVSEYLVSVNLGFCGDFDVDNDGDVDLIDYAAFAVEFTGPNP
ncbi:MAG: hypothetical protein GXP29_15210 [Planctomycetes bacterium]|nr:hypothetical protein [Planctomycetota bacterium]